MDSETVRELFLCIFCFIFRLAVRALAEEEVVGGAITGATGFGAV